MSYDIHFEAKLEGMDKRVAVGPSWLSITSDAATMIKEVCGSYPSDWCGKKCSEMYSVLMQGASLLNLNPSEYKPFEIDKAWGNTSQVCDFLMGVADVCMEYPAATIQVTY